MLADAGTVDALRADPDLGPLVDELAEDCARVELARRFHNDAVVTARALRSRRRVRWLRLAGHAAELATVDLDDVPPTSLAADRARRRTVGWAHPDEPGWAPRARARGQPREGRQ